MVGLVWRWVLVWSGACAAPLFLPSAGNISVRNRAGMHNDSATSARDSRLSGPGEHTLEPLPPDADNMRKGNRGAGRP